jgi:hypothetical protein
MGSSVVVLIEQEEGERVDGRRGLECRRDDLGFTSERVLKKRNRRVSLARSLARRTRGREQTDLQRLRTQTLLPLIAPSLVRTDRRRRVAAQDLRPPPAADSSWTMLDAFDRARIG